MVSTKDQSKPRARSKNLRPKLIFLISSAIISGGILIFNISTLDSSFQHYINMVELERIEPATHFLEQRYQSSASWDFLRQDFAIETALAPPANSGLQLPPIGARPLPPHLRALARRISIYDLNGKRIWGSEQADDNGGRRELLSAGKLIGYIRLSPGISMSADADMFFLREQTMIYLAGSAVALLVLGIFGSYLLKDSARQKEQLIQALTELKEGREHNFLDRDDEPELVDAFDNLANSLAELDRGHRQWLADTSHELRTPIAVLRAQVEAFQDGVQAITPRNVSVLHDEIMALSKLVDDLHWLSKHDVGQIKNNSVAVDISQTLQDVLESFQERRIAKEIKIENLVPAEEKLIVNIDPARLRQVFTNLTENSLRYTNKGGTLRISHAIDASFLRIYFDDSEPGVPDDILTRIFERFFRVESSRNRSFGGSGLGLAICLNNMQMLGGKIEASHSPLGGLRIELTLPMVQQQ